MLLRPRTPHLLIGALAVTCLTAGLTAQSFEAVGDTSSGFPEPGAALFEDSAQTKPARTWGRVDCARRSRHQRVADGGDFHPTAPGVPQADDSFRRLRVLDRDDHYGERCELGLNDWRHSPVALYHEGERRLTFVSFRLPDHFPLGRNAWQVVMQMKQTWPAAGSGGYPALALHAFDGQWFLYRRFDPEPIWSAPARRETWTRFAFDIRYSQSAETGSVRVYADLNEDGDAHDPGEVSPRVPGPTLKPEGRGNGKGRGRGPDGVPRGDSIPSHLRVGIYHKPAIRCRRPAGCRIEVDNVGVYEPG